MASPGVEIIDLDSYDFLDAADTIVLSDSDSIVLPDSDSDSDSVVITSISPDVISLDSDDDSEDVSVDDLELRILSLSEYNDAFVSRTRIDRNDRRRNQRYGSLLCSTPQGLSLAVGMCVELDDKDFLFIESIFPSRVAFGPCRMRGILLRRNVRLNHMHPVLDNEVSALMHITDGEQNPSLYQSLVIRTTSDVKSVRELIFTNAEFPEYRSPTTEYDGRIHFRNEARLICRTKHIRYCVDEKENARVVGEAIVNLNEDDVDSVNGRKVSDVEQMVRWTSSITGPPNCSHGEIQQMTFGDICCGAGGATRAADQLGLKISFGVDHDRIACETYRRNWREADTIHQSIFRFLQGPKRKVHILHISFPCQVYSRAHTIAGKNDDANSAVWSSIGPIIDHCHPRVIVFEQADGIRNVQHRDVFQSWFRELTTKGYSARWSILNAAQHGHVQARKRLFIIASCPGEPLPPFPQPTHGPGLQKWVTIADRLALLPTHEPETHMKLCTQKNGQPYDRNTVLRYCITTNGGQGNLHPCGTRTFTIRELALLQGFDQGHLFAPTNIGTLRRQIGNAVALAVEKAILQEVIMSMYVFNTRVAAWRPEDEFMILD